MVPFAMAISRPPDDQDDHARMTGPSYRGISNRGTATRGTANRGPVAPALSAFRQAAPGAAAPGVGGVTGQSFIGRTLTTARDAARRALAAAQAQAEAIHDAQRPFFLSTFRPLAPKNARLGDKVPIKVVEQPEFGTLLERRNAAMNVVFVAEMVRLRPAHVQRNLQALAQRGALVRSYSPPITAATKIHPVDGNLLSPPPSQGRAGAFYDPGNDVVVIRIDQVDAGIVAHEACHAYTSAPWNAMQIVLGVYDLEPAATEIDEGVTSEMANLALFNMAVATQVKVPGMPIQAPNAYAGYLANVQARAARFMRASDNSAGTPGPNAIAAYFEGDLTLQISSSDPRKSKLRLGTKIVSVAALL